MLFILIYYIVLSWNRGYKLNDNVTLNYFEPLWNLQSNQKILTEFWNCNISWQSVTLIFNSHARTGLVCTYSIIRLQCLPNMIYLYFDMLHIQAVLWSPIYPKNAEKFYQNVTFNGFEYIIWVTWNITNKTKTISPM